MTCRVFLDIETLPPGEEERDRIPAGLVRKLARRRRNDDGEECSEEQYRRLALHGECGRLLTVSVIVEEDGRIIQKGLLGRERRNSLFHFDEGRTLRAFWKLIRDFKMGRDLIVGHNVLCFDMPFLYKRSYVHGVQPSVELPFTRYRNRPIFDTMQVWSGWDYRYFLSLSDLGLILGVGSKTEGMDGGRVYDCIRAGDHETVARYALRDVELVRAIYYRMTAPGSFIPDFGPGEGGQEEKNGG